MEAFKGKYVRAWSTEDTRWKSLRRGGREVAVQDGLPHHGYQGQSHGYSRLPGHSWEEEEEEEGRRNIATDREGLITKVNLELEGIPARIMLVKTVTFGGNEEIKHVQKLKKVWI